MRVDKTDFSRISDFDGKFFRGAKSDSDPGVLPLGYYWMGVNVINTGGVISCRPGYRCIVKFPQGKLQGATIFRPKVGLEQLLVCISGIVYVASYPFTEFKVVPNVLMSPSAKQIYWQLTVQSARRITTDFSSAIEVIDPRVVLFIQDGGFTAPAWFDGSNSGHIRDNAFETPAGASMSWVGDRLWVAAGSKVFASDIANPFSFREQTYLGGTDAFNFATEVTAMARTPSLEFPQLVVWTQNDCSIIEANIRNRDLWPTTNDMQKEVFQIGCSSQRSIISHFGQIIWYAPSGFFWFDAAVAGKITSRIPIRDNEMMISKTRIGDDLSLVAGGAFGNYIVMSVPADDLFNKHTWVVNHASLETITDDSGPSWAGYWLGTRPVEWVYGNVAGSERIYHVSTDEDGENRLWECFTPDRLDNGCPITWAVESRGYFGESAQVEKNPGADCRFSWAEVSLTGIEEDLDFGIFVAGGARGAYKQILGKRVSVERGNIRFDRPITASSRLFGYKAQARRLRSQDANQISPEQDSGTCPVESENNEDIDESFQLLIVGQGPATIRWIRTLAYQSPDKFQADPKACEDETQFNVIRFDGAGAKDVDLETANNLLQSKTIAYFTSFKSVTVTQEGISVVGTGFAESIISQSTADRVAERIATRAAEAELLQRLPKTLSGSEA